MQVDSRAARARAKSSVVTRDIDASRGRPAGSVQDLDERAILNWIRFMASIDAIPIPLPQVGSVNAWLLRGDPVTVVDTGPRSDEALDALERGLRVRGLALEDVELVLGTHHHHDHVGLAATIKR